jgi:hypothetical protein
MRSNILTVLFNVAARVGVSLDSSSAQSSLASGMLAVGCAANLSSINNLNQASVQADISKLHSLQFLFRPMLHGFFLFIGFVYLLRFLAPLFPLA